MMFTGRIIDNYTIQNEGDFMEKHIDRIRDKRFQNCIVTADEAASWIENGMTLGLSGFTRAGDAKAVPVALVEKVKQSSFI